MARASTMVNAISLLRLKGWHAPAGRRTCETPASSPGQADQTGAAGGCQKIWDPADRSFRRTTRTASAESEVRPGPRLPTLRPYHLKTGEAGPEAPIHILPADYGQRRTAQLGRAAVRRLPNYGADCGCVTRTVMAG